MSKTSNTNEFIEKANKIHGYYDYSLFEYINAFTKSKIVCSKHGIFEQTPKAAIAIWTNDKTGLPVYHLFSNARINSPSTSTIRLVGV